MMNLSKFKMNSTLEESACKIIEKYIFDLSNNEFLSSMIGKNPNILRKNCLFNKYIIQNIFYKLNIYLIK